MKNSLSNNGFNFLRILPHNDPILRNKNRLVSKDEILEVKLLAENMIETCESVGGLGLAAPQIGENIKICVVRLKNGFETMINPKITYESKTKKKKMEGCLSFKGYFGIVERPTKIKVHYHNGEIPIEKEFIGFDARKVLHEIDHLNGILYTDKNKLILNYNILIFSIYAVTFLIIFLIQFYAYNIKII